MVKGKQPQEQQPPCTPWEQELSKEMASYKNNLAKDDAYHHPGPFNRVQLSRAAREFHKRWWKESEEATLEERDDFEKQRHLIMETTEKVFSFRFGVPGLFRDSSG